MGKAFVQWYRAHTADGDNIAEAACDSAGGKCIWVESERACDGNDKTCRAGGVTCG
jgi:hypothetical protein